jgi:hypothetical protein
MFSITHRSISSRTQIHLLLAFALLFLSPLGNCATFYVDWNQSNGKCVDKATFKTIQRAVNCAKNINEAYTILVTARPDRYGRTTITRLEDTVNKIKPKKLVIRAINGTAKPLTQGFVIKGDNVTIDGFDIQIKIKNESYAGVAVGGDDNQILNNNIHDLYGEGIDVAGGSPTGNLIQGNVIMKARMAGIQVRGSSNRVIDNDISHTIKYPVDAPTRDGPDADGIRFFGKGNIFKKNTIHDISLEDVGNDYPVQRKEPNGPHIDCFQTWHSNVSNTRFEQNTCNNDNYGQQGWLIDPYDNEGNDPKPIADLVFINNSVKAYKGISLTKDTNSIIANNTFIGGNIGKTWPWGSKAPGKKKFKQEQMMDELFEILTNLDKEDDVRVPTGYGIELHFSENARVQNNLFYNHSYILKHKYGPNGPFGSDGEGYPDLGVDWEDIQGDEDGIDDGPDITRTTLIAGSNADYVGKGIRQPSYQNLDQYVAPIDDPKVTSDYHLTRDSTDLRNKGIEVPEVTNDIDGDPRPYPTGGKYDIGADEYMP